MSLEKNMSMQDFINGTQQPSACSTEIRKESKSSVLIEIKQEVKRNLMNMDVSGDSLGILSLDDMRPVKGPLIDSSSSILENRQKQLASTCALLQKFASRKNSLTSESTVNESDLQDPSTATPVELTPAKCSTISESDLLNQSHPSNISSMQSLQSHDVFNLSKKSFSECINDLKLRFAADSTASLSDILNNQTKMEFDSGMFQPAEIMKGQFEEDENAWRQKYACMPNTQTTIMSEMGTSSMVDDKISMGEFFRLKSDNCSLFNKQSPVRHQPIPLLNSTTLEDVADDRNTSMISNISAISQNSGSILSISGIQNLISSDEKTPNSLLKKLCKAPLSTNNISNQQQTISQQFSVTQSKGAILKPALQNEEYYNSRASLGSPAMKSASKLLKYASSDDLSTGVSRQSTLTKMYSTKSLNSITNNKENQVTPERLEEKDKSLTSCRSTSSMDSIPEGVLKLASTKNELVWGCVKAGRSVLEDVTIRNKCNRRVKYAISMNNSNFKLANVDVQGDRAIIMLHPLETRQLFVSCSPSAVGPLVGKMIFTPFVRREEQIHNPQHIALYAYGGDVNIQIRGQTQDLAGKLWISLGCVDGRQVLSAEFVICNSGTIDGFVLLTIASKSLCAYEDISLTPSKVVIKRRSQATVRVQFRPSKNDLQLLNAALGSRTKSAEIAVIRMISGAEINRQRINQMVRKNSKEKECDAKLQNPLIQQLSAPFQNARQHDDELRAFTESFKSQKSLMQVLDSTEISLLVERDMDCTLMPEVDDSTFLFKTMVSPENSMMSDRLSEHSYTICFNVEPTKVLLTPPSKCNDYLLLNSNYDRPVGFKISFAPEGSLTLHPSNGIINPGEIRQIKVECGAKTTLVRQDFDVVFDIEDVALTVIVSVLNL